MQHGCSGGTGHPSLCHNQNRVCVEEQPWPLHRPYIHATSMHPHLHLCSHAAMSLSMHCLHPCIIRACIRPLIMLLPILKRDLGGGYRGVECLLSQSPYNLGFQNLLRTSIEKAGGVCTVSFPLQLEKLGKDMFCWGCLVRLCRKAVLASESGTPHQSFRHWVIDSGGDWSLKMKQKVTEEM